MKTRRYARIKGGEPNSQKKGVNVNTIQLPNYKSNTVVTQPVEKSYPKQYAKQLYTTSLIKPNNFSIVNVARNPTRSTSPPPPKEMVTNIPSSQQQVEPVVVPNNKKFGLQRLPASRSLTPTNLTKGGKRYSKTRKHRKNRK